MPGLKRAKKITYTSKATELRNWLKKRDDTFLKPIVYIN